MSNIERVISMFEQIEQAKHSELELWEKISEEDLNPLSFVNKDYEWLLTDARSNYWKIIDETLPNGSHKGEASIVFERPLPNGQFMSDYPDALNAIKAAVIFTRSGHEKFRKYTSASNQVKYAGLLLSIFTEVIELGLTRFDQVTDEMMDVIVQKLRYPLFDIENHYEKVKKIIDSFNEKSIKLPMLILDKSQKPAKKNNIFQICEKQNLRIDSLEDFKGSHIEYVQQACLLIQEYEELNGPLVRAESDRLLDEKMIANIAMLDGSKLSNTQCKRTRNLLWKSSIESKYYVKRKVLEQVKGFEEIELNQFRKPLKRDSLVKNYTMIDSFYSMGWKLCEFGFDRLKGNAFRTITPAKKAIEIGVANGNTNIIPERCALHFMDRALRWVVDYGNELLDLYESMEAKYPDEYLTDRHKAKGVHGDLLSESQEKYVIKLASADLLNKTLLINDIRENHEYEKEFPASPFPLINLKKTSYEYGQEQRKNFKGDYSKATKSQGKLTDLYREIADYAIENKKQLTSLSESVEVFLPVACFSVILAMNGRRDIEGNTLKAGCVTGEYPNLWIETYVAKKEAVVNDSFPTEMTTKIAVQILERITKRARALTGDDTLNKITKFGTNEVKKFDLSKKINAFAKFIGTPNDPETGKPFIFNPHQFRKLFAIMFYWQFGAKDLDTLGYHFRHARSSWTRDYIENQITASLMSEYEKKRMYSLFTPAGQRNEKLKGPFVEQFKELAGKINSKVSKNFKFITNREVKRVVDDNDLQLDFLEYGMCVGRSKCRIDLCDCGNSFDKDNIEIPGFNNAEISMCMGCKNFFSHEHVLKEYKQDEIDIDRYIASSAIFKLFSELKT